MTAMRNQPEEARQHRRLPFRGAVHLQDRYGDVLRAFDLSEGGVGVHSDRPQGIGQRVEVVLLDGNVRVKGVIRYELQTQAHGWRIGIQFLQPQPELLAVALALPSGKGT
jgi:hypothetical protein